MVGVGVGWDGLSQAGWSVRGWAVLARNRGGHPCLFSPCGCMLRAVPVGRAGPLVCHESRGRPSGAGYKSARLQAQLYQHV
jgi:hypothetical protein